MSRHPPATTPAPDAPVPPSGHAQPPPPHDHDVHAPAVFGAYKVGWRTLWGHFGILLILLLVVFAISLPSSILTNLVDFTAADRLTVSVWVVLLAVTLALGFLYDLLVVAPVAAGVQLGYLQAVTGRDPEPKVAWYAFRMWGGFVVAEILAGLLIVAGLLAFILPGIWVAVRLSFMPLVVVTTGVGGAEAVRRSWALTRGHFWPLFGIGLVAIPIVLLGVLLFLVGIVPATMWVQATLASYFHLLAKTPEGAAALGFQPPEDAPPPSSVPAPS